MANNYLRKCINGKRKAVHRLVAEAHLDRLLLSSEQVHHVDGDIHNNDISNLKVMPIEEHSSLHSAERMSRPEERKRMSDLRKGRKHNEETKKKMSSTHLGMRHSEETKKKLSDIQRQQCNGAKLTWPIVRAIRELFKRKCPVTKCRVAEYFGVCAWTVYAILRGETWTSANDEVTI